jgi:hypothetical protein
LGLFRVGNRRSLSQGPMRTVAVEMIGVDLQHGFEMASGEDQQPVCALAADAAYPALGEGVCSWALRWCPQHSDAGRREDGVEGVGELGVPVPDEEAKTVGPVVQVHEQIPGLLRHPRAVGFRVAPSTWTWRVAISTTKNT